MRTLSRACICSIIRKLSAMSGTRVAGLAVLIFRTSRWDRPAAGSPGEHDGGSSASTNGRPGVLIRGVAIRGVARTFPGHRPIRSVLGQGRMAGMSIQIAATLGGKHSRGRPDDGLQGWEGSCARGLSGVGVRWSSVGVSC